MSDIALVRDALIAEAEGRHAHYPQYRGHWDGWRVGRITRDVYFRNCRHPQFLSASAGDIVLVEPVGRHWASSYPFTVTVHLPNSCVGGGIGIDTALYHSDVKIVDDPGFESREALRLALAAWNLVGVLCGTVV